MESAKQNPITPTTTCKIPRKARIINLSLVALLAVALISNIALLAKPVFNGTYKASVSNGETVKIRFYDNTYTYTQEKDNKCTYCKSGFFIFFHANKYDDIEEFPAIDEIRRSIIVLADIPNLESDYLYQKSVFKLTEKTSSGNINFYCGTAIFLQVLYVLTIAISIIVLFCYNPSIQKKLQNKKAPKPIE